MNLNLEDKIVFITGGSHGIGRAIGVELAREGCKIAFCARGMKRIEETCSKINEINNSANFGIVADVFDVDKLKHAIDSTIQKWGKISLLRKFIKSMMPYL